MRYRENKLNRRSTLEALEQTYKTQLDALNHPLMGALQAKKTETDVIAETLELLSRLRMRFIAEMMTEVDSTTGASKVASGRDGAWRAGRDLRALGRPSGKPY